MFSGLWSIVYYCSPFVLVLSSISILHTVWKVSKYGVISGPYFPAFEVNTERYEVSLRIHSECGKIQTRNNSVFGHFSRSDTVCYKDESMLRKKVFLKDFFSKYDQVHWKPHIWSNFMKKSWMENLILWS